ncbi:MAG: elongator complex protein 3 [Acutalibacteraceae bacterium]
MSHSNISIFIPHIGCPCRCSFCNQVYITGRNEMPTENDINNAVETALKSKRYQKSDGQIAFFGGSFTAIDRNLMTRYLEIGYSHILKGNAESIRISTRPDAINQEILDVLKQYGVKSIELGAQSMSDDVLTANHRGHTARDVYNAAVLIKNNGFEFGLQMMMDLHKSNFETDLYTANEFVKIAPETVRIYPTVVLKNTLLEKLYLNGEYQPLSVEEAAKNGSKLLKLFYDNNINVIRFGLHSIEKDSFVAGAFHPALNEIAQGYIYREIIDKSITNKGFYTVFVKDTELSKAKGQKKSNIEFFKKKHIFLDIVPDKMMGKYEIKLKERNESAE